MNQPGIESALTSPVAAQPVAAQPVAPSPAAVAPARPRWCGLAHEWGLQRLELSVHIGTEPEERALRQLIEVSVTVRNHTQPAGCLSDRLADTLALDAVAERVRGIAEAGSFALLEHLAQRLHDGLGELCPPGSALDLRVTKLAPPIPRLRGGTSFRICSTETALESGLTPRSQDC